MFSKLNLSQYSSENAEVNIHVKFASFSVVPMSVKFAITEISSTNGAVVLSYFWNLKKGQSLKKSGTVGRSEVDSIIYVVKECFMNYLCSLHFLFPIDFNLKLISNFHNFYYLSSFPMKWIPFISVCVVSKDPQTFNWSSMSDDGITQGWGGGKEFWALFHKS